MKRKTLLIYYPLSQISYIHYIKVHDETILGCKWPCPPKLAKNTCKRAAALFKTRNDTALLSLSLSCWVVSHESIWGDYSLSLSLSLTQSLSLTHTHTISHTLTHTRSLSISPTFSHSFTLSHFHSLSLSLSLSLSHSLSLTFTLSLSLSLSLSLFQEVIKLLSVKL